MLRASDFALESWAFERWPRKFGRAIPARMPMMRMTTRSSIKVKPPSSNPTRFRSFSMSLSSLRRLSWGLEPLCARLDERAEGAAFLRWFRRRSPLAACAGRPGEGRSGWWNDRREPRLPPCPSSGRALAAGGRALARRGASRARVPAALLGGGGRGGRAGGGGDAAPLRGGQHLRGVPESDRALRSAPEDAPGRAVLRGAHPHRRGLRVRRLTPATPCPATNLLASAVDSWSRIRTPSTPRS